MKSFLLTAAAAMMFACVSSQSAFGQRGPDHDPFNKPTQDLPDDFDPETDEVPGGASVNDVSVKMNADGTFSGRYSGDIDVMVGSTFLGSMNPRQELEAHYNALRGGIEFFVQDKVVDAISKYDFDFPVRRIKDVRVVLGSNSTYQINLDPVSDRITIDYAIGRNELSCVADLAGLRDPTISIFGNLLVHMEIETNDSATDPFTVLAIEASLVDVDVDIDGVGTELAIIGWFGYDLEQLGVAAINDAMSGANAAPYDLGDALQGKIDGLKADLSTAMLALNKDMVDLDFDVDAQRMLINLGKKSNWRQQFQSFQSIGFRP